MNTTLTRLAWSVSVLLALAACQKKDNSIEPPSSASERPTVAASPASAPSPLPGVIPVQPDLPQAHTGAGPGHGNTAIGGLTGTQESGGQTSGPPQPTGGDAAPKQP